jgi:hypothetical protein
MPLRTGRRDWLWGAAGVIVLGLVAFSVAAVVFGGDDVQTYGEVAGVKCQSGEQLKVHSHVRLAIFMEGEEVDVPDHTGIVFEPTPTPTPPPGAPTAKPERKCLFWLHTHTDQLLHVEAPSDPGYTLGQFFEIWGQPLSETQLMDRTAGEGTEINATVNGEPWDGNPADIPLVDGAIIAVQLGPPFAEPPTELID